MWIIYECMCLTIYAVASAAVMGRCMRCSSFCHFSLWCYTNTKPSATTATASHYQTGRSSMHYGRMSKGGDDSVGLACLAWLGCLGSCLSVLVCMSRAIEEVTSPRTRDPKRMKKTTASLHTLHDNASSNDDNATSITYHGHAKRLSLRPLDFFRLFAGRI